MCFVSFLLLGASQGSALDIEGRVVDGATLDAEGKAKGIAGAQVTAYLGRRALAAVTTNATGHYRLRNLSSGRVKVVYKAAGYQPAALIRHYNLAPSDTGAHDAALDRPPKSNAVNHYRRLARGWEAQALLASHYREAWDSAFTLGGAYIEGDSSADYRGALLHLAWEAFLSQDRPPEARFHMAHALKPRLDSLGWGPPPGLERYLECDPIAVENLLADIRAALKDPKTIPTPKAVRKNGIPAQLASSLAARELARAGLTMRKREAFRVKWKEAWGRELPEPAVEGEAAPFKPDLAVAALAERQPESPTAQFLKGRARFAARDYAGASEALALANRLRPGVFSAARYLEAMAFMKQGLDAEARGRFHALRESPSPAWKARAYYGLGILNAKEGRNAEAASDLWRAVRIIPDPETVLLLAEVSVKLNDNAQAETLLEEMVAKTPGEHRAHYWLGRFAEGRDQVGVAEEHFRKAWQASPLPEYAEARARLLAAREEWTAAIAVLEPLKAKLSPEGHERYADCLLRAGRSHDAVKEFAAAYAARPDGALLGRYVDALLQDGRAEEALKVASAGKDPNHPAARLALAKASLRLG
ncbi:MAG TPA: tetratricopeptide repeat protein, partial [Fibrobacteria bacterium]|nr:tetratricopeptide repeat protein [Fibrobacteria bacterium]